MKKRYIVREYRESDLQDVAKAFKEGFKPRVRTVAVFDEAHPKFLEDVVKLSIEFGDVVLVAEADGKARGILVGSFLDKGILTKLLRLLPVFGSLIPKLFSFRTLVALFESTIDMSVFAPYYVRDAPSVDLLASQQGYRGGIGRAMMDRWVELVKERGYEFTIVGTDERMSWQFYERYGFQRYKSFPMIPDILTNPWKRILGFMYHIRVG